MTVIVCADDRGGVLFNHRRQSMDRAVRADILRMAGDGRLWVDAYTIGQFPQPHPPILRESEDPLSQAGAEDLCFLERQGLENYLPHADRLVVYRWGRIYPADRCLELPPPGWRLLSQTHFTGSSHPVLTKEVYLP